MSIDNTRGPSTPNILHALSEVQEAGAGISAQSAQQLLYGAMMEDEITNCINQLTAGLSIKPQFPGGMPPISNCPPEEGLLEASSMPMTSLSMQAARRLPGAAELSPNEKNQKTWDAYGVGQPDETDEPLPSPSTAKDMEISKSVKERLDNFWDGMMTDFEEREGVDKVQYEYDRDMSYLLSEGAKLLKSTQGASEWTSFNLLNDVRHFLSDAKARVESQYEKGMAAAQGAGSSAGGNEAFLVAKLRDLAQLVKKNLD